MILRRSKLDLILVAVFIFTFYLILRECFSPVHARVRLNGVYKTKSPDSGRVSELSSKAGFNLSAESKPPNWFAQKSVWAKKLTAAPPRKIAQSQLSVLSKGRPIGYDYINGTSIPKIIWQKWKNRVDFTNFWRQEDYIREGWLTWNGFNREYEHIVLSDVDAELFVRREYSHRPDIVKVFVELQQRIIAFDLLRYLVIYKYGGIYNDMDTQCRKPIDDWLSDFWDYGIVVGVECLIPIEDSLPVDVQLDPFNVVYAVQFLQWTVMAQPNHPVLNRTIETLVSRVLNDTMENGKVEWEIGDLWYEPMAILNVSGPGLWTRTVKGYINEREGREVADSEYRDMQWDITIFGDLLLLPQEKWAPSAGGQHDDVAFLKHYWRGSWR
ncbi:membrane-bound alpha-1,6- mannosyltransferase Initiation-specific [Arthrobotrys megalospora]